MQGDERVESGDKGYADDKDNLPRHAKRIAVSSLKNLQLIEKRIYAYFCGEVCDSVACRLLFTFVNENKTFNI
ncbi:MAG: hypothetical protein R3E13_06770 [Alphaproteobacteria bacterium]